MIYSEVIIVGGGLAGSTCAWKLKQSGIDCLILDKQNFPRPKLCAGWITPEVVKNLKINLKTYPHSLLTFNKIHINIFGRNLELRTCQYSIRRYEFDSWLLMRSGAPVNTHFVREIKKENGFYVIDNKYRCKYLVGAGGTICPVYRTFFQEINPRARRNLIVAIEDEFVCDYQDNNCYLWFFENKLPGYAWYVPKGKSYLNVGIGGLLNGVEKNHETIKMHWELFITKLRDLSLLKNYRSKPSGYIYYKRGGIKKVHIDNAFIVGDAAGLATKDLGEGIGPAIKSGLLAAGAIINEDKYSLSSVKKYSMFSIIWDHFLRSFLPFSSIS